jgi:hypothetical protein
MINESTRFIKTISKQKANNRFNCHSLLRYNSNKPQLIIISISHNIYAQFVGRAG